MIVGIGIDSVEIARIAELLERFEESGRGRVFTAAELALAGSGARRAETLAGRFAAKEATMKALQAGVGQGVAFAEIELLRDDNSAPRLVLHGGAAARATALGVARSHVSFTHTATTATAIVVLER